ncbi:hypothetical protein ABMA27_015910 [Loxostege sticticalis]|uniref:Cytoplasmic dynein 2 heavy chain 1 n=1 Tax=Loxostege sticticalis TaxID=481309 RepID=A0ABR3I4S9_LOXSC
MGVVIVGPPGSGKTTIRRLLKSALASQGKNIVEYVICPKAMSRNCLLGHIDHDTRQWTDGVISSTALEISNQPSDVWSWVVCDGDIDPEWIEALNSVLDDNRLLTLPSGWRIQFGSNVNFIFETHSLEHASPATVSRMGIILLSDESSCAQEVLDNWMKKIEIENDSFKVAAPLLQQAIKKCLEWFRANQSNILIKSYDFSLVKQIITQFEYIAQNTGSNTSPSIPEDIAYSAIERSVLGILKENSVDSFHQKLSDTLGTPPTPIVTAGEWVSENLYLSSRLAACEPAVRACALSQDSHLLLVGPDATAKSALIEYVLKETNLTAITIDCTPILEPEDIIAELKRNNAVRSGGGYGGGESGGGGRVALVVRSLQRAASDSWRCSAVHQFLLQLIQYGGFWSRGGGEEGGAAWCGSRVLMLASATAPPHSPRLAAALSHISIPEPDDEELLELAKNYLRQNVDKKVNEKDITNVAANMLSMFKEVTETFYSQSHYKWNADHLRQWCENVKWYSPANSTELIMGIQDEANAIFRDRLVTDDEKGRFNAIAKQYLKSNSNATVYYVPKLKSDGIYMEAMEYNDWCQRTQKLINQCLTENENVFGDSGAEVCSELGTLCSSMARACRGGIGLSVLVGSAGVGRRAAAQLAAAQLPATLVLITNPQHFHSLMKNALGSASDGTRTLVLICESVAGAVQLSGIEALHAANSVHAVPAHMMPAQNSPHMLQNIKQNLGIAICLDKDQENVWEVIEKYPLLYNSGHVVWLERWSADTLRQMPALVIQRLVKESLTEVSKEELQAIPTEGFVQIYESLETSWSRSPCRYINFIKTYFNLVNKKKQALAQRQTMLSAGVEALRRARSEVATLQAEAAEQQAALGEKQESANRALEQIAATVRANTDQREEMQVLKKNIETENDKLQIRKKEIEDELASVEPVIAAARSAVGDIRPESLSEIRSLRAPPDVVRDVLEGVLRLMGIADTSWHSMKNFLSKRGVKEDIRCMDASQITPEAVESVEKLLKTRGGSFEPTTAKRASAACAPLAAWVRANLAYAGALARVRPLQVQQAKLHKNLRAAEEQLNALSSGLATVDERVAALQQQLGQHTRDAAALELRLGAAKQTIAAATALIDTLAHEYDAWETDLEHISKEIVQLNSRSLLASAYIVYLPDVTEQQARERLKKWGALIGFDDESFSVLNFLSTPEKQLKWEADGLPSDTSAIKNAVLIDQALQAQRCGFTPLVIDPDGEAITWLKNTLAETQCDFVSQHSEKLLTAVQYAVRLGRTLVITDVDSMHESWAGLLYGGHAARLVLVSRDAALGARLPPPRAARLAPLHFTARLEALTDQLVYYALQRLNPEVNNKSKEIKLKKATLQKQQHELQENLLRDLSSNNDILHDANLLASLNKTRETGATIAEALAAAHAITTKMMKLLGEIYCRPTATRAASLALAVKRLAAHRPLLALPVDVVLDVYVDALRRGDAKNIDNDEVIKYITRRIIERVLLGLHKKDKYIIVLHILKQVYYDAIPDKLWQLFLGNVIGNDEQKTIDEIKKIYTWIPNDRIKKVVQLKTVDEELFNKLSLQNADLWNEFLSTGDLNVVSRLRLNEFETVVAVAALRPDSLYRAIIAFVDHLLGAGWWSGSEAVSTAAKWCAGRSSAAGGTGRGVRPALVLAAHAADVLASYARARRTTLTQVGVDDGISAWEAAVEAARGSGGWLALLVGASPFNDDLHNFIASFGQRPAEDFNEEFRIWIVSEDRDIPPLIANACVNVILEAPEGVKHNVLGTLSAWGGFEGEPLLVRAHACLALFHAVVQERRAYIPQGWSQWYAWEWGEVVACCAALRSGGVGTRALVLALYGARAHAAPDRAALAALHRATLADHALASVWRPLGLSLRLPLANTTQAYSSAFEALPQIDTPQLLGLPANCRIAWERTAANDIINGLKELDSTTNTYQENKTSVTPLKLILALWKKLMSGSPLLKADYQIDQRVVGWWGSVCASEVREAARAARALHQAFATLARQSHRAPPLHKVPEEWHALWAGPARPDAYVREFCARAHAAHARMSAPFADDYLPKEVDLRGWLRPARAVWALRAVSAARTGTAPGALNLSVKWDCTEISRESGASVVVVGLRLSGAEWAGVALAPPAPTAPPHAPAPPLLLRFLPKSGSSALSPEGTAEVPLFASAARAECVCAVRAPLAPPLDRDAAALHAVALYVAPAD